MLLLGLATQGCQFPGTSPVKPRVKQNVQTEKNKQTNVEREVAVGFHVVPLSKSKAGVRNVDLRDTEENRRNNARKHDYMKSHPGHITPAKNPLLSSNKEFESYIKTVMLTCRVFASPWICSGSAF